MPDDVESYNNFEGVLSIYAGASCSGCRSTEHNGCSIEGCFLLECTKNHGVDFCGECNEFPCKMLMYGREAQDKTWIASPATIPKSGERNRKIHSCMLYLISI